MSDGDEAMIKIGELENKPIWVPRESNIVGTNEYTTLKKLNKEAQVQLLKDAGVKKIPEHEEDRIKLIIELKGGK